MNKDSKLIFVTNDDGYQATGIRTLIKNLTPLGKVIAVAPDTEQSATGHSLSLRQPLRLDLREKTDEYEIHSCNGKPTDCVTLGINFLVEKRPDILVSGINAGGNLGDDITYSGTVMAAMEGASQGIPSVAVSLVSEDKGADYSPAAKFAVEFCKELFGFSRAEEVFFSINVPDVGEKEIMGAMVTAQGRSFYKHKIVERLDPWGRNYYWITGLRTTGEIEENTDFYALKNNLISVTPLQVCMTNKGYLEDLKKWRVFKDSNLRASK